MPPLKNLVGKEIVGLDVELLIKKLNAAYADEWIAYYQYWVCARLVEGPMSGDVKKELEEHAASEYGHASLLADRIIHLGGIPLLKHEDWTTHATCGYDATKNAYVRVVLEENIKGEQCAIRYYNDLLEFIGENDPVTFDIIVKILADETEHEFDLKRLLNDLDSLASRS